MGERSSLHLCSSFPVYTTTKVITAILASHFIVIAFIYFGRIKNAVYFLLTTVVLVALGAGGWFFMMAYVYLLCEPVPYAELIFLPSLLLFPLFTAALFIVYWRPRLDRVMEINRHAYDFSAMRFYYLRDLVGLDGKSTSHVASYTVAVATISAMAFASADSSLSLHNPDPLTGIGFFIFVWLLGYITVGVVCFNQLYIAWVFHKKSQKSGRKMIVAELDE